MVTWPSLVRIYSLLTSILAIWTDLKRIQTPQSFFRDFGADKILTIHWSGCQVQVWVQVKAPAAVLLSPIIHSFWLYKCPTCPYPPCCCAVSPRHCLPVWCQADCQTYSLQVLHLVQNFDPSWLENHSKIHWFEESKPTWTVLPLILKKKTVYYDKHQTYLKKHLYTKDVHQHLLDMKWTKQSSEAESELRWELYQMPTVLNIDPNNMYKQLTEKNLLENGEKIHSVGEKS